MVGGPPKCLKIAAMCSELIAIGVNGQMYQWKWNESESYKHADVSVAPTKIFVYICSVMKKYFDA